MGTDGSQPEKDQFPLARFVRIQRSINETALN